MKTLIKLLKWAGGGGAYAAAVIAALVLTVALTHADDQPTLDEHSPLWSETPRHTVSTLFWSRGPSIFEEFAFKAETVSLTSPTTAIDVTGKGMVIVNSDANQTGITFTGATQYQIFLIGTGAGSNTFRFDDGTSYGLGGSNVTFTEGQDDWGLFMCTDDASSSFVLLTVINND